MQRLTDRKACAETFLENLRQSSNSVVLTGAGISTASGIPDFRGSNGLYSKISQRTFEIDYFNDFPAEYYSIAVEYIHPLADREPNATHMLLSKLESANLIKAVITQNIDRLHHKAGSKNVIEFHGNVELFYCTACDKPFDRQFVDHQVMTNKIPLCDNCQGLIRPAIVFFGDPVSEDAIIESRFLAEKSGFFIAMGSSLEVNPAAGLAIQAKDAGAKLCIVNLGPTYLDPYADLRLETDLTAFSNEVLSLLDS